MGDRAPAFLPRLVPDTMVEETFGVQAPSPLFDRQQSGEHGDVRTGELE
jgi:hypothetical protein